MRKSPGKSSCRPGQKSSASWVWSILCLQLFYNIASYQSCWLAFHSTCPSGFQRGAFQNQPGDRRLHAFTCILVVIFNHPNSHLVLAGCLVPTTKQKQLLGDYQWMNPIYRISQNQCILRHKSHKLHQIIFLVIDQAKSTYVASEQLLLLLQGNV